MRKYELMYIIRPNIEEEAINEYTRLANISEDIIRHIAVREEEK